MTILSPIEQVEESFQKKLEETFFGWKVMFCGKYYPSSPVLRTESYNIVVPGDMLMKEWFVKKQSKLEMMFMGRVYSSPGADESYWLDETKDAIRNILQKNTDESIIFISIDYWSFATI